MNDFLIANICTVLSTMKADQKWAPAHDEAYLLGLEDLPDEAGAVLRREILRQWDWRPSVKEIRALWQTITAPPADAAEEVAGLMLRKRRQKGLYQWRIPGDPCCRWEVREPPWGAHQSVERRVSLGMGGWAAFCADDSPLGVLRSQLTKLAAAVLGGSGDADLDRLRLEYEQSRPAPAVLAQRADAGPESPALPPHWGPASRHEAAAIMAGLTPRASAEGAVALGAEREKAGAA